ncbi:predicted protein [Plenodomus lingam JN3]|uniref:Predicted protein n=1 Tax=Leptosphaeria maculans (strain JN3 / isolate v23.1.3 / race Av1-4-5-6-7-8) TaxID=985895 RepID=E5R486_LEPMJ|nr:predicted protein [Plenodomus lingam JN3]CBX91854.1 predicted protein [Plenodomus lingam JN3]
MTSLSVQSTNFPLHGQLIIPRQIHNQPYLEITIQDPGSQASMSSVLRFPISPAFRQERSEVEVMRRRFCGCRRGRVDLQILVTVFLVPGVLILVVVVGFGGWGARMAGHGRWLWTACNRGSRRAVSFGGGAQLSAYLKQPERMDPTRCLLMVVGPIGRETYSFPL